VALRIEKTFQVKEPLDKVWSFLSDPRKVAVCVPGAQITGQVDEKTYKGAISVKVGPSVTDYKGEVTIVRLDPQNHEIEILGKGQDVRGRGSASMKMTGKLRALADGGTEVTSISELNVVGILAQMGSRVITEVSNIMFAEFTRNFQTHLEGLANASEPAAEATAKPISAFSLVWQAVKQVFHRLKLALSFHSKRTNHADLPDAPRAQANQRRR
jgi:carbon monoxide dehydrogenase subunit G